MKLSTKKIIGIGASTLALVGLVDWLAPKGALQSYLQVAVLMAAVAISALLLGWARPRSSERKLASLVLVLAAMVYQLALFVLLGRKLGFVTNIYRWNFASILQVFLPLILAIITLETLRGQLVEKGRSSKLAVYLTAGLICAIQIAIILPAYLPLNMANLFSLMVVVCFPAILTNILLTYIAYAYDYRANIGYRLVMELPAYLLPIFPDVSSYLGALFLVLFVAGLIIGYVCFAKWSKPFAAETARNRGRRYLNDREQRWCKILKNTCIGFGVGILITYVALMSGLFKYYFLAIGSGSMEPSLYRGDLILVEKMGRYDTIEQGDILVYQRKNTTVVHRVSAVEASGQSYRFHTKGDANSSEDSWQVEQKDVIGVVRGRMISLGYPTLWLAEIISNHGE